MATLRDALVKAGLVNPDDASFQEEMKKLHLETMEKVSKLVVRARSAADEVAAEVEDRRLKKEAKQYKKAASNRGSKEYLKRFK